MDSKWYAEDRLLPKHEQAEAMAATEVALKNSTLMTRRLGDILDGMIDRTMRDDENFEKPDWQVRAIANASARKTLRQIAKLLP